MPDPDLTLIANVALERIDGGPWTSGGCPTFALHAFHRLGAHGDINVACADEDRNAFRALERDEALRVRFLSAGRTSRFDLSYGGPSGETRSMVVHAIGHSWSVADVEGLEIAGEWVHLAPLLRSDFPVATVARLAALGHRISYDGQGLVRVPRRGELTLDAVFDRELLPFLTVLKLSDEEAAVLAGGRAPSSVLDDLAAVPELLLTHGSRGAEVRAGGHTRLVAPDRVIAGVQATGAGDAFMVGYGVGRRRGLPPQEAAALGASVASAMLAARKAGASPTADEDYPAG